MPMIKIVCKQCEKEFMGFPSQHRKYCSKACLNESKRTTDLLAGNPSWLPLDHDQLKELYSVQKKSINDVAKIMKVDRRTIRRHLIYLTIPLRTYEEQFKIECSRGRMREAQKHHIIGGSSKRNRKNYLKIAKENFDWACNVRDKRKTNDHFDLVVHHKDGNNKNNKVSNIEILCQGCHARLHTSERWKNVGCF